MKIETLKKIIDAFYQRTYIPISLIDQQQKLHYPAYSPLYLHLHDFPYLTKKDQL